MKTTYLAMIFLLSLSACGGEDLDYIKEIDSDESAPISDEECLDETFIIEGCEDVAP